MTEPKRILDTDPLSGDVVTWEYDDLTGKFIIATHGDVGPTLDDNKRQQNDGTDGWLDRRHNSRRVASIPKIVAEMWLRLYGVDVLNRAHTGAMMKLLNSSEWRDLRTAEWNTGTNWKS